MAQRDYIMRMIEQLGAALVSLRRVILGGTANRETVRRTLRDSADSVGFNLDLARAATVDTVRLLVAPTGEIEPGRCWLIAEVLYLDGLDLELQGSVDDALHQYAKATALYELLEPEGLIIAGLPEATERLAEIEVRSSALQAQSEGRGGVRP